MPAACRRRPISVLMTAVIVLTLGESQAEAAVEVGQTPQLRVPADTHGGRRMDLGDLRGRVVVVDFWASSCPICTRLAPQKVAIQEKFAERGLQFVGVSLDPAPAVMQKTVDDLGMAWPHHLDGSREVRRAFGVTGTPVTFLIGPDGIVLWSGHPGQGLEEAIVAAYEKFPPVEASPATTEDSGSATSAAKPSPFVPRPTPSPAGGADALLTAARAFEKRGNDVAAYKRYREIVDKHPGTPAATAAAEALAKYDADADLLARVNADATSGQARARLSMAKSYLSAGKTDEGRDRLRQIVAEFPGTPDAREAERLLDAPK